MSYRINYGSSHRKMGNPITKFRLPALTGLCFLLFLTLVNTFWPEGSAYLSDKAHHWRESAAVLALDRLAEELHHGEPLAEAFSDFLSSIHP